MNTYFNISVYIGGSECSFHRGMGVQAETWTPGVPWQESCASVCNLAQIRIIPG